jgi:hypothetical protein
MHSRLMPDHLIAPRDFRQEPGQQLAETGLCARAEKPSLARCQGVHLALSGLKRLKVAVVGAGKESEGHRMR